MIWFERAYLTILDNLFFFRTFKTHAQDASNFEDEGGFAPKIVENKKQFELLEMTLLSLTPLG